MNILYQDNKVLIEEYNNYSDGDSGMSMTFGVSTKYRLFEKIQKKFWFLKWTELDYINAWDVGYFKHKFNYKYTDQDVIDVILNWYSKQ